MFNETLNVNLKKIGPRKKKGYKLLILGIVWKTQTTLFHHKKLFEFLKYNNSYEFLYSEPDKHILFIIIKNIMLNTIYLHKKKKKYKIIDDTKCENMNEKEIKISSNNLRI